MVEAIIDGIRWEGSETMLLAVLLARQEIQRQREEIPYVCDDCGGTGQTTRGEYDNIEVVPCICVKRTLGHTKNED